MGAAWITGASSGIGAALARELDRRGWDLALSARRERDLGDLARGLRRAIVVPLDVGQTDAVYAAAREAARELGGLDLAIANAGVRSLLTPADRASPAGIDEVLRIDLVGAVHTLQAALGEMAPRRRGHLVGISSLAARAPLPESAAYCAAKAGLTMYLDAMRLDLEPLSIAVTTVHPGFVKTPALDGAGVATPFLWEPERAARVICDGIDARARDVSFPWPMRVAMRVMQHVPGAVLRAGAARRG